MFPDESDLKSFIVGKSYYEREDVSSQMKKKKAQRFEELTQILELKHLLDLPLVALSNGQTKHDEQGSSRGS